MEFGFLFQLPAEGGRGNGPRLRLGASPSCLRRCGSTGPGLWEEISQSRRQPRNSHELQRSQEHAARFWGPAGPTSLPAASTAGTEPKRTPHAADKVTLSSKSARKERKLHEGEYDDSKVRKKGKVKSPGTKPKWRWEKRAEAVLVPELKILFASHGKDCNITDCFLYN